MWWCVPEIPDTLEVSSIEFKGSLGSMGRLFQIKAQTNKFWRLLVATLGSPFIYAKV